jgi:hypothetical protein
LVRTDIARLHTLAAEKGYFAERALVRGCWRLISETTGDWVLRESRTSVFTLAQASNS